MLFRSIQNPANFLKLAGFKFLSYWGMVRPHYSALHNILIMCFYYPLYFFAIIGFWHLWKINKYFFLFSAGLLAIFTLSVMFTCDDWNNRFNMPILPFVFLAAAIGVNSFLKRKIKEL